MRLQTTSLEMVETSALSACPSFSFPPTVLAGKSHHMGQTPRLLHSPPD
jgi:hypothetical protein